MTLKELEIGKSAVIETVGGSGELRQHFLDMGMIPGAEVTVVKLAPMGDPMELQVHGYELTLRLAEADQIEIAPISKRTREHKGLDRVTDAEHPGLGEDGKYHSKKDENPLPEGTTLTFALAGNQNCGKTTLFNQLTGSNQHVGNFPGVTVDRKDGSIKGYPDTLVTCPVFIPCPLIVVKRSYPVILSCMRNPELSLISWMRRISSVICI